MPDAYMRGLDSLVRFYNSQITVHVGYLLTSIAVLFGFFSLTRDWVQGNFSFFIFSFPIGVFSVPLTIAQSAAIWTAMSFLAILAAYLFVPVQYPICFQYFLGRTQYYICLSEAVWIHMGINTNDAGYVKQLSERVLRPDLNGIRAGVMRLFEVYLYLSACHRRDVKVDSNWKAIFSISEQADWDTSQPHYDRSVLGIWNLTDLLNRSYRHSLEMYENSRVDNEREIFRLFNSLGVVK